MLKIFQEMPLKFAGEHQWVVYNEVILGETGGLADKSFRIQVTGAMRFWQTEQQREPSHLAQCKIYW